MRSAVRCWPAFQTDTSIARAPLDNMSLNLDVGLQSVCRHVLVDWLERIRIDTLARPDEAGRMAADTRSRQWYKLAQRSARQTYVYRKIEALWPRLWRRFSPSVGVNVGGLGPFSFVLRSTPIGNRCVALQLTLVQSFPTTKRTREFAFYYYFFSLSWSRIFFFKKSSIILMDSYFVCMELIFLPMVIPLHTACQCVRGIGTQPVTHVLSRWSGLLAWSSFFFMCQWCECVFL